MAKEKVKSTIWVDRRIKKAFRVVCSYRNISVQKAVSYLMAWYVLNDGMIPKFDTEEASKKIIKYAKITDYKTTDLEGGLDEQERKLAEEGN